MEKNMFLYETHVHTSPVSKCARATVRDTLSFYKRLGYAGVFMTDHFIDGNINIERTAPFKDRIDLFFSAYEEGVEIGKELGISVFCGLEMSLAGTDFLVYGVDKNWFLEREELAALRKPEQLSMLMEAGALIVQAHPFREASYIEYIRLLPRYVHGVEVFNACRTPFENEMARQYAKNYGLLPFAGSDNHRGEGQEILGGMCTDTPLQSEQDFVNRVKDGRAKPFRYAWGAGELSLL